MAHIEIVPRIFALSQNFSEILAFTFFDRCSKSRPTSRSQSTIFSMTQFDGKYQNLQTSFLQLWFRQDTNCDNENVTHIHTYTHTERRTRPWLSVKVPDLPNNFFHFCLQLMTVYWKEVPLLPATLWCTSLDPTNGCQTENLA